MKNNDWILDNKKLSKVMKKYLTEINRLEQFRDIIRQKQFSNLGYEQTVQLALKKNIDRARGQFEMINDMYSGKTHQDPTIIINGAGGFIDLANEGLNYIKRIFIRYSKSKNKTVNEALRKLHRVF